MNISTPFLKLIGEFMPCAFPSSKGINSEIVAKPECFTKDGLTIIIQLLSLFALSLAGGIFAMKSLDQMFGKGETNNNGRIIDKVESKGETDKENDETRQSENRMKIGDNGVTDIANVRVKKTMKKFRVEQNIDG